MKKISALTVLLVFVSSVLSFAGDKKPLKVEKVLDKIEQRYKGDGFSASFRQETPLKAIGIKEKANGKTFFKKGGKLRWDYENPDKISYISDGKSLWIHSIEDNQIWKGSAANFFGKSGGAAFLTDINKLRKEFIVKEMVKKDKDYILTLEPSQGGLGISIVKLTVSGINFDIVKVDTINSNNSETSIFLNDFDYSTIPDDKLFTFTIPEGANVIPLE